MIDLKYNHLTRQLDILDVSKLDININIVGAGAIGSFTALLLAKSGFHNITVYDFDSVSVENMNNQFYRFSDIGKQKVSALASLIFDFTNIKIKAVDRAFEAKDLQGLQGILITAVDSMAVRKLIFENIYFSFLDLVIDPRMSAEFLNCFTYSASDTKDYDKTLVDDKDSVQESCTAKSTAYTASLSSGLVMKTVKNFVMNEQILNKCFWDIKSVSRPFIN